MSDDLSFFPELASDWRRVPLKGVCDYRVSNVDKVPSDDELPVRLCNYVDVYHNEFITPNLELMKATATEAEVSRFGLDVGDVIITKDSESWDDIGVPAVVAESAPDMVCGYHLAMLRPMSGVLDGRYLFRCLQARPMQYQFERTVSGVTRYGLGLDAIGRLMLPLPPLAAQKSIADYLDRETAKIDAMIAAKERLLKLLAEKRRALITHAVTRGLNPEASMRDSGVEWLGEIPEHWRIAPLRYLVDIAGGSTPDKGNNAYWNGDIPWVSPKDMKRDLIGDSINRITDLAFQETSVSYIPKNSVLIVIRGMILAHTLPVAITSREVTINQDMKALRCDQQIYPDYLRAYLKAIDTYVLSQADQSSHGTKKLDTEMLGALPVALPPKVEQEAIVSAVTESADRVDSLIEQLKKSNQLLVERRSSLIAAAVTGDIEVEAAV